MDLVLGLAVLLMPWLALAVVVTPPVVMAAGHRWPVSSLALWLAGSLLSVGWLVASVVEMDRVDATGGTGNAFSTVAWLVAAVAAAGAAIWSARPRRSGAARRDTGA